MDQNKDNENNKKVSPSIILQTIDHDMGEEPNNLEDLSGDLRINSYNRGREKNFSRQQIVSSKSYKIYNMERKSNNGYPEQ